MGWRYQGIPNPISVLVRAAVAVVLGLLGRRVGLMLRLMVIGMGFSRRREPQGQRGEHSQSESLSGHSVERGQRERASKAGATVSARQPQPCGGCYQTGRCATRRQAQPPLDIPRDVDRLDAALIPSVAGTIPSLATANAQAGGALGMACVRDETRPRRPCLDPVHWMADINRRSPGCRRKSPS